MYDPRELAEPNVEEHNLPIPLQYVISMHGTQQLLEASKCSCRGELCSLLFANDSIACGGNK